MTGAMTDRTGNMPLPGIFPDYSAPIVRNQPEGRELAMGRWQDGGSGYGGDAPKAGLLL